MKPFDIFIAFVSWSTGGKNRPLLVLAADAVAVDAYKITTQYASKSEAIRRNYFEIKDWAQSGLNQTSYVDTGTIITLPTAALKGKTPIGRLAASDKIRLLEFLDN
jgi:mRNA-degrading endonuclease toxin of MazEF toxin-antitoxin module